MVSGISLPNLSTIADSVTSWFNNTSQSILSALDSANDALFSPGTAENNYEDAGWLSSILDPRISWKRSTQLSNTTYQRALEDATTAGLNTNILYGGSGSGSLSGASAAVHDSGGSARSNVLNLFSTVLGSALKVATTSMMSESQMAQTLARNQSALEVANITRKFDSTHHYPDKVPGHDYSKVRPNESDWFTKLDGE